MTHDPPASASRVLKLYMKATMPSFTFILFIKQNAEGSIFQICVEIKWP